MRVLATVYCAVAVAAGVNVGRERGASVTRVPAVAVVPGSFLSLWERGARHGIAIERFSLASGRPLRSLFTEPPRIGAPELADPHVDRARTVWVTTDSGPLCTGAGFECGGLKPDSCQSSVQQFAPGGGRPRTALTFPNSDLVQDAVPSPDGEQVALYTASCTSSYFDSHYVVRDLPSGREWSLGADARACHSLSSPAWNAAGTALVFTYGSSTLAAGTRPPSTGGAPACTVPRRAGIVVVTADRFSTAASWRVIRHRAGCGYESAAFDTAGIVAFEACAPKPSAGPEDDFLGPDYVVQLDLHGRVLFRLSLTIGANPGHVASNPETRDVLVTQDQTYNDQYRRRPTSTYNYVWQLTGRHLRLIARYPFTSEALIAAQPS